MDCGEESASLVLKKHVVAWGETNASTEDVLNAFTLTGKGVDDRSAFRDLGALEEIREDGEDGGKALRLVHALCLVCDTGHELSEDDKVEHERGSKERVLAGVVDGDGVAATHEDLRSVLVHGTLRVTDIRNILDDDAVVGVLTFCVENAVSVNDIIDDRALGDLLGTELCRAAEVLSVVVAEVVVADDGADLETSADKEVSKDALDLGLARLEVITSNVDAVGVASSTAPGTRVFWGLPLMKQHFSRMAATAKRVEGAISFSLRSMEARSSSAVLLRPSRISAKRSVVAVQRTTTVSSFLDSLKLRISARMCSTRALCPMEASRMLSARSSWLAAMKSGK